LSQEWIAFSLVGVCFFYWVYQFYRRALAKKISYYFLKKGKVKIAMWIKEGSFLNKKKD